LFGYDPVGDGTDISQPGLRMSLVLAVNGSIIVLAIYRLVGAEACTLSLSTT